MHFNLECLSNRLQNNLHVFQSLESHKLSHNHNVLKKNCFARLGSTSWLDSPATGLFQQQVRADCSEAGASVSPRWSCWQQPDPFLLCSVQACLQPTIPFCNDLKQVVFYFYFFLFWWQFLTSTRNPYQQVQQHSSSRVFILTENFWFQMSACFQVVRSLLLVFEVLHLPIFWFCSMFISLILPVSWVTSSCSAANSSSLSSSSANNFLFCSSSLRKDGHDQQTWTLFCSSNVFGAQDFFNLNKFVKFVVPSGRTDGSTPWPPAPNRTAVSEGLDVWGLIAAM